MDINERRTCPVCGVAICLFNRKGEHVASELHFIDTKEQVTERLSKTTVRVKRRNTCRTLIN
jgi:hypothetical protein